MQTIVRDSEIANVYILHCILRSPGDGEYETEICRRRKAGNDINLLLNLMATH